MASVDQQVDELTSGALERIGESNDRQRLEEVRVELLGKKGEVTRVLRGLSSLPQDQRPAAGRVVNRAKVKIQNALAERHRELVASERSASLGGRQTDITLPAYGQPAGHIHPLSATSAEICRVLGCLGFSIAEGPDIEDEYHNFEALNIPSDHPARDMQDTFFVESGQVLRTHTSPVQIRVMESSEPPLRIIAPGAVYRHDDDVTHSPMFHQVEGLLVDRGISFGHLKYVLTRFLHRIFGSHSPVRFRPSYFPFTEPSAEVDIGCVMCGGSGADKAAVCRVCKGSGWLEILGAGMVDPAVLDNVGYDPALYSGFAFGVGVERVAMLKYRIGDIRLLYGGDLRFLEQF